MVVDPYKNPAVQKRMLELQQTRYRRGHRNAVDARGNPAYILTDDERISCLDPSIQQTVRQDMQRIKVLEDYAKPFVLTVGIGNSPPSYIVNVTHPQWGHARRQGATNTVDNLSNPEFWFKQQIDNMKQELGYKEEPKQEAAEKYLKMQEEKRQVADAKKQRHLICPDHGNEMVRGTEPGTLVCTVVGCKRVARKKPRSTAAAVKEPEKEEPAVEESPVASDLAKTFEDMDKYFGAHAAMPDYSTQASEAAALNIQKLLDAAGLLGAATAAMTPNQNVPKILQENNRWYLIQVVSPGREAYVDITTCYPDVRTNKYDTVIETVVTLNNVRPY